VVKIDQTYSFWVVRVSQRQSTRRVNCRQLLVWHPTEFRPPPRAGLPLFASPPSDPNTLFYVECWWCIIGAPRTFDEPTDDMASNPTKDAFNPQAFLAKVGTGKTISVYQKDQIVFSQGEVADTIFYLQKGGVKVVVLSDQGKEAVVGILEPGQFFGEGCMNGHSLRIATSTATEESLITAITKSAMIATLHDEPKFSELFVAYLLTRNSRVEDDLIDQLFNSSEKRLARLLLLLAKFGKEGSPEPISPNISQETLAEMIGTTRSRVSFFLNKFRKLGFISYNGKIEVHGSLLDAILHDKPRLQRDEKANIP
jgi:CRP/FNR family transcriptional regulator, cyclic AMP receptor protein